MADIHHDTYQKTVQDLVNLYERDQLNLSPGFQRESVWNESDRAKLIDSIIRQYPLPSIFLYRRRANGELVYDVIDGKQRIETILRFMGVIKGQRFHAKVQLPGEDPTRVVTWDWIRKHHHQHLLTGYSLTAIEVDGDLSDIIDLFVRINSTGKALTSAEKRHAKYYNSEFLRVAGKTARNFEEYFKSEKILSAAQIIRMKHVELLCELMISIYQGDVLNKKTALDKVMQANSFTASQTRVARDRTVQALNRVRRMFPNLRQCRFHQVSDFYSLVVLMAKFETEKMILTNRRRNGLAWDLLSTFSTGVELVREAQKKAKGVGPSLETQREYLLTVQQATDEIAQRRRREDILRDLLQSLFEKKDSARLFSLGQRRILWGASSARKCAACGKPVTWEDFTVDHINPYSKGGATKFENAALMHRRCNSAKGGR
jgi:5-methylcytosine-specific restriction endonuclease McrA